jgi:Cu(I)/Ag(I) efflux system protein CusF
MRRSIVMLASALTLAAASLPAWAQGEMVDGQVTKVDPSAGKITIRHGPIKSFDMDTGMTMVFRVPDPGVLKQVKPGDKIKFEASKVNGQFTATKIQKAK